jgi:hypothetical protein
MWRKNPKLKVAILERGRCLQKLNFGGGRCNARYFEPNELVKFYPRGEKRTTRTFISFALATIEWFENMA